MFVHMIFWTKEHFVAKSGMVMQHHEQKKFQKHLATEEASIPALAKPLSLYERKKGLRLQSMGSLHRPTGHGETREAQREKATGPCMLRVAKEPQKTKSQLVRASQGAPKTEPPEVLWHGWVDKA